MLGSKNIACLEVNSTEMTLYAEEYCQGSFTHPVAVEKCSFSGFSADLFYKPEEVFNALQELFASIESRAILPRKIFVSLPQSIISYCNQEAELNVNGKKVTANDIKKIYSSCEADDPSLSVISCAPLSFRTFANPVLFDPVGEVCDTLYANVNCACVNKKVKELFDNASKRLGKKFVYTTDNSVVLYGLEKRGVNIPNAQRLLLIMRDHSLSVSYCVGKATLKTANIPWGAVIYSRCVEEKFGVPESVAEKLIDKADLNIDFVEKGSYILFDGGVVNKYGIIAVNSTLIEYTSFLAGEVKKAVDGFRLDKLPPVFVTGDKRCNILGLNNIFNEALNTKTVIKKDSGAYIADCLIAYAKSESGDDWLTKIKTFR